MIEGDLGGIQEDDPSVTVDQLVHVGGLGHLHLSLHIEPGYSWHCSRHPYPQSLVKYC